jgi:hypothetical protein
MRPRARDTLHRLKRLWIISDRRIIGPCLHLLTSVGTAVKELGHDVITFDLAQLVLRRVGSLSERLRRNEWAGRNQRAWRHMCDVLPIGSVRLLYLDEVTSQAMLFGHFNS